MLASKAFDNFSEAKEKCYLKWDFIQQILCCQATVQPTFGS